MLKLRAKIIVLLVIPFVCIQCNIFKKKVEKIDIKRFEVDFYATDTTDFLSAIEALSVKYPKFYPVFVEDVLPIAENYKSIGGYIDLLYEFRTHPSMLGLIDSIEYHYSNLAWLEDEFSQAIEIYKKNFPAAEDLEVVTFVSEFGNKAILYPGGIGISLDMFLGEQYPFYKGMQLPDFIIKYLSKEQILPNAMRILAEDYVVSSPQDSKLLDKIITEGKRLYFAEAMLPKTQKHQIIEYTKEQYDWCLENEFNVWGFFVEGNLLYNSKYTEFKRYVEDGPSTLGMPAEAPSKIAVWLGWQIVREFMEKNKNVSLAELMEIEDAQEILNRAKYKPQP